MNLYAPFLRFVWSVALFPATTPRLEIQVRLYPFFGGGFYFTGPHGPLDRAIRTALWFIDIRIWLCLPGDYAKDVASAHTKPIESEPTAGGK